MATFTALVTRLQLLLVVRRGLGGGVGSLSGTMLLDNEHASFDGDVIVITDLRKKFKKTEF